MAEFIDIIAQLKFEVEGDGKLKGASTEAEHLSRHINGLKDAIVKADTQAKKGILQNELKKANKEAQALNKTTTALHSGFSNLKNLAAGFLGGFGLVQLGQQVIAATSTFQKFEAVLTNITGDNGEAKKLIKTFSEFAAQTPFQIEEVVGVYVKLRNTGIIPTIETIRQLGDLASSSGKSLDQLAEALIDAQTGQNERLKEFGIRAERVGQKAKFTFRGITTEVDNSAEAIQNYIVGLGKMEGIAGSNAAIAGTLAGQISNLKDTFTTFAKTLGDIVAPALSSIIYLMGQVIEGWAFILKRYQAFQENVQTAQAIVGKDGVGRTGSRENKQFNFVRDMLTELDKAIDFGGKGTLARVKYLQGQVNQAFEDGLITKDVLFAISAKFQEVGADAQAEMFKKVTDNTKKAATDPKAAQARKEAIKAITDDLTRLIREQENEIASTQLEAKEDSLEKIKQQNSLEKTAALQTIDDRRKAIKEKLKGNVPADIEALLNEIEVNITRKFDLLLEQSSNEFKEKRKALIEEFEIKRAAEKAKQKAEEAEAAAQAQMKFLASLSTIKDEEIAAVEIAENEALLAAETAYQKGLISKERFEQLKTDITKTQGIARLKLLVAELEVEKLALQNLEDKDGKLAERIREINVLISQLNLQIGQMQTVEKKQNSLFQNIKTGYNEALNVVKMINSAIVQNETEKYNRLIALQQQRVDEANRIADEGNAEALEREKTRLEVLTQQREQAAQRQQRLSLILQASNFALAASEAILAMTKTTAQSTVAAPVIIPLVGAALAAGIGFILSLINATKGNIQQFAEGERYVMGSDGIDKVPAMLTKGERVITVADNQRYGSIYDYLTDNKPNPNAILSRLTSTTPDYAGLQIAYELNRRIDAERTLRNGLLEKLTLVNGNLEILVKQGNQKSLVKIINPDDIAKGLSDNLMRWKI